MVAYVNRLSQAHTRKQVLMGLLLLIIVLAIAISIVRRLPRSACTGDCNQGRDCTCQPTKTTDQ